MSEWEIEIKKYRNKGCKSEKDNKFLFYYFKKTSISIELLKTMIEILGDIA